MSAPHITTGPDNGRTNICPCGRTWSPGHAATAARGLCNTCYNRMRRQAVRRGDWEPMTFVDATGTRRRLRALARIGWGYRRVALEAGLPHAILSRICSGAQPTLHPDTSRRVADLFGRLEMTPGPSRESIRRATAKGWPPPLAWDPDTIDDPAAEPAGVPAKRKRRTLPPNFAAIIADHRALGRTDDAIAERIGIDVDTLHKRLDRLGIPRGRRWRDIEDADCNNPANTNPITRADAYRLVSTRNLGPLNTIRGEAS